MTLRSVEVTASRSRDEATGETQFFEHLGRRVCMKQLANEHGIPLMTLYQRWHRGDRGERLVRPGRSYRNGK